MKEKIERGKDKENQKVIKDAEYERAEERLEMTKRMSGEKCRWETQILDLLKNTKIQF